MSHLLFFLCPNCFSEDTLGRNRCKNCKSPIKLEKDGIICQNKFYPAAAYYDLLNENLKLVSEPKEDLPKNMLRVSGKAHLRQGENTFRFNGYHKLFGRFIPHFHKKMAGEFIFYDDLIVFQKNGAGLFRWHANEFTSATTNGHYLEFKIKHSALFQIEFAKESALKYQFLLRKWLNRYYEKQGLGKIIEYQPRIIKSLPAAGKRKWEIPAADMKEKPFLLEKIIMNGIRYLIGLFCRLWIRVKIIGRENWHSQERGIVIVNHESGMDPFIIAAFLDRYIAFLTKDTVFSSGFTRFFMRWAMGIPTSRYQTDAPVVYGIKSMLARGVKVGVFPEGERCWDGRLQPFKLGLVKILMASREAIFPIIVKNAFTFWPRWRNRPCKTDVELSVKAPFCLIPDLYSVDEQRQFLESLMRY